MNERLLLRLSTALFTGVAMATHAQGTFLNLDFESANVTGYPPGGSVPISMALPHWTAFTSNPSGTNDPIGTNILTKVWYDQRSLGGAAVALIDTTNTPYGPFTALDGRYSVWLFGSGGSGGHDTSATISQTGLVPMNARSLEILLSGAPSDLLITLGGQTVTLIPLETFTNCTLYGGDISALAGRTAELDITALATHLPNAELIDDVTFAPYSIPEPSAIGLLGLSACFLSRGFLCRKR